MKAYTLALEPNFAIDLLIRDIEGVLAREKRLLGGEVTLDANTIMQEKLRLLRQLNQIRLPLENQPEGGDARAKLLRIKALVDENAEELSTRINAIREVASSIEKAIAESENDGTYQL